MIIIHSLADVRITAESPSANALDLLSGPMTLADRLALKSALAVYVQGLVDTAALVPDLQAAVAARDARIAELEEQLASVVPVEYIEGVKIWPNTEYFIAEFTPEELAAIALSVHPTIAAMRLLLSAWHSTVRTDDARVIAGLDALQAEGIITNERWLQIITVS